MANALTIVAQNDYAKIATASIGSTFPSLVPTTTAPTAGVLAVAYQEGNRTIQLMPYTSASAGPPTFAMRIVAYSRYIDSTGAIWYMPNILATFTPALEIGRAHV